MSCIFTRDPHFVITTRVLLAKLLPFPPNLGDLVERRIADGERKPVFGQARMKEFENLRRKNDRLVSVVYHLHLRYQVVPFDVGVSHLEVRQVGLGSDHGPAETLGRHRAKVDPAAGPDVETWNNPKSC